MREPPPDASLEFERAVLTVVATVLFSGQAAVSLDEDLTATGALTSLNRIRILSELSAIAPDGDAAVDYLSISFRTPRDLIHAFIDRLPVSDEHSA